MVDVVGVANARDRCDDCRIDVDGIRWGVALLLSLSDFGAMQVLEEVLSTTL